LHLLARLLELLLHLLPLGPRDLHLSFSHLLCVLDDCVERLQVIVDGVFGKLDTLALRPVLGFEPAHEQLGCIPLELEGLFERDLDSLLHGLLPIFDHRLLLCFLLFEVCRLAHWWIV